MYVFAEELMRLQLVGMVDVVFADVAQPDQARIVSLNASYFLKVGGHFIISIKASCIDSTAAPEAVFAAEVSFHALYSSLGLHSFLLSGRVLATSLAATTLFLPSCSKKLCSLCA
jgi:hypothetical protein